MPLRGGSVRAVLGCCALVALPGCGSKPGAPNPAATQPAGAPQRSAEVGGSAALLPQSQRWSRRQAAARLADQSAGLSAAVRLVRLAGLTPICLPDPLPHRIAERLRLVRLSPAWWALGRSAGPAGRNRRRAAQRGPRSAAARLQSSVLIHADGRVELPVTGAEEEVSLLYVSADPGLFPHLLITPLRVLIVAEQVRPAIVVRSLGGCRFALRQAAGFPYLALVLPPKPAAAALEVARYTWDPYELAFMGPVADRLPDPPGGRFEIDLRRSAALVPVGGEIPPPEPAPRHPRPQESPEHPPPG